MAVDSTSLYNPYAMMYGLNAQNGLSDDFMWNAYMANSQKTAQGGQQQTFTGNNLSGQPATDCYQGSSALTDGLKLAAVGGAGVGLGMYYFGGDKVNPISNGVFHDDVLKAVEEDYKEVAKGKALEDFSKAKEAEVKAQGFKDIKEFEATKKYVNATETERAAMPKELTDLVKAEAKSNPESFKATILQTDGAIANLDIEAIGKKALEEARQNHLGYQSEQLVNFQKQKSLISGLANDADKAKFTELIKSNPKAFGIDKTEASEIEAEAKRIANSFTSRESALTEIDGKITNQLDVVRNTRTHVNGTVINHWDDAAKELKPTASPELAKAVKNFKFTKAGKAGLIAAGVGLVLGWMFGGKS